MGYSTHLYSVDIDSLKAAVGSKDDGLLDRVRAAEGGVPGERPVDPTKGPRVRLTWRSEIVVDGVLRTLDEFKQMLLRPDWKGMNLYVHHEDPPRGQPLEGPFQDRGSFIRFFWTLGPFYAEHGLDRGPFVGIVACSGEQFASLDEPPEEPTDEEAVADLIAGKPPRRGCGHVYGYALEALCRGLGTPLGPVGTDCLRWLQVKTPLSKKRSPIKLPRIEDFPVISYLDAAETRGEVERLRSMDLAYPNDPEVEQERRRFLMLLESAAEQGRGVVGFYY